MKPAQPLSIPDSILIECWGTDEGHLQNCGADFAAPCICDHEAEGEETT